MKRLVFVTLAIAVAISLVAVMGVRSLGGSTNVVSADFTGTPHVEIDLVKEAGESWCQSITTTASVPVSATTYQVAICLTDSTAPPAAFQFDFVYDSQLDSCSDATGSALDANPDANTGSTTFSTPDLGTGWDCNIQSVAPPTCAKGGTAGTAFLKCQTVTGTTTLPNGAGVSAPLAVVNLKAISAGVDNLAIQNAAVFDPDGLGIIAACSAATCKGATETKTAPPTATPLPPLPSECDIATNGDWAANPTTLNMKVGAAPAIVDVTGSWKNLGAFTPGAPAAPACDVGFVYGAMATTATPGVYGPIPAGISVRVEPFGAPAALGYGDVCFVCYNTGVGKDIATCMKGHGPFDNPPVPSSTWTYTAVPCDEPADFNPALPMSIHNESCENAVDDPNSAAGCDWRNFSLACGGVPDPACLDVQAIGLRPAVLPILTPGASTAQLPRTVKIQCNARGTYGVVLFGSSAQPGIHALGRIADPNPANDAGYALVTVTCTQGPEMVKDCDPSTEGIQTACNLWLMNPKFAGGTEPDGTVLPKADANGCVLPDKGKGCLAVDIWLKSAGDDDDTNDADLLPECLGAWEHQVRFDHKIIRLVDDLNPKTIENNGGPPADVSWLESTGRIANCSTTVYAENWILEGCVTTDGPAAGMQVGPCGDGIIEKMLIVPQTQDLIYRGIFRPTKDNGVVTNIVDDNCEITDIYAEPMADTLAGGLTPICGNLTVTVRMLEGDVDLDCDVDVADQQAIAFRYGASWGLQLYDQWFDLEPKYADQDIDIKDLQFIFGRNFSTCQHPIPDDQAIPVPPAQPDP